MMTAVEPRRWPEREHGVGCKYCLPGYNYSGSLGYVATSGAWTDTPLVVCTEHAIPCLCFLPQRRRSGASIGGVARLNWSEQTTPPNFRWNFFAYLVDITSFSVAFSFISVDTIAPALVSQVTSSALLIGLVGTIFRGSWMVPQLAIAQAVKDKPRKKPYLVPGIVGRMVALGMLIAALFGGLAGRPGLMLIFIYVSLSLFAISDGVIAVSWFDILARAIPAQRRGRLFGISQAVGRLAGMGVGVIIAQILGNPALEFPTNYGLLYLFAAAALVPSALALLALREPPLDGLVSQESVENSGGWLEVLRSDRTFRRLMWCRILAAALMLASSFFVVHAAEVAQLPESAVGQFVTAQTLGGLVASLALGWVSERFGPRAVIRIGTGISVLAPLLGMLADLLGGSAVFYYGIFIAMGVSYSIWTLGFFNYLLEIAPERLRPVYVGAGNTIMGVTTLAPIMGGWLLEATSYLVLFTVTAVVMGFAFLLALRLNEHPEVEAG